MNTITISGPSLLPPKLEFRMIQGSQDYCMAKFKSDHPNYDPGTVFRCDRLQVSYFPMNFNGGAKAAK
jgi:hypothetical protein